MSKPQDKFIIDDLDTLRVVSDPLRNQILELLILDKLTVKQIGDRLGLAASKLYYHIRQLEKQKLIAMVETRMVANLQEKYYRAVANTYMVDPELLSFHSEDGPDNINSVIRSTLNSTREDFMRSLEAGLLQTLKQPQEGEPSRAFLTRHLSRIPKARVDEFITQLEQFMKDFEAADVDDDQGDEELSTYAFTAAFYPSLYFPENEDSS
ncbi:MAG: winged helix-turn-helix domain-containing protein [Chloroflexota bacterium]